MKGLFFSSRSLSMSAPDLPPDEKHKSKSKHREESTKSSPRPKFKREKVTKNAESKTETSTFQRCRKMVSLKRFSAQDRLKRLRSNLPLQNKIIDQVCSEPSTNIHDESNCTKNTTCDPKKNSDVSSKRNSTDCNNLAKEITSESAPKTRYSADSRLKKIRAAFLKKVMNKRPLESKIENNACEDDHVQKIIHPISTSDECIEEKSSNKVQGLERANSESDSCMDVDQDSSFSSQNCEITGDADYSKTSCEEDTVSSPPMNSYVTEEICKFRNERAYLALHESFVPDIVMNLAIPIGDVFIVMDTNILLSHLRFVHQLLTSDIRPYKCPIIVIPWLVLQEIDYATKKNNLELSPRAKAANTFIFEFLKKKHPRLFGQSLEDFKNTYKNAVSVDDCILQYCLKFVSLEKNVILLTDDINLCNKSMVNQLSVFTKKEFERNFFLTED